MDEAWRATIRRFVERNLADASQSPDTVAKHFGFGERHLHDLFSRTDQSSWLGCCRAASSAAPRRCETRCFASARSPTSHFPEASPISPTLGGRSRPSMRSHRASGGDAMHVAAPPCERSKRARLPADFRRIGQANLQHGFGPANLKTRVHAHSVMGRPRRPPRGIAALWPRASTAPPLGAIRGGWNSGASCSSRTAPTTRG